MLKNDKWILKQAEQGMIAPFERSLIREITFDPRVPIAPNEEPSIHLVTTPAISYGLSSYGYDIRLSPAEFLIFRHVPGTVVNPKAFNPENLEAASLKRDEYGEYFVIPANSYGLGVSLERINMPPNVTVICLGKSTYARVGLIANICPLESSWTGHITLEFSNSSSTDCRIYANEGVTQLLFFEGEPCSVTYGDRSGKYQNQEHQVTLPRV